MKPPASGIAQDLSVEGKAARATRRHARLSELQALILPPLLRKAPETALFAFSATSPAKILVAGQDFGGDYWIVGRDGGSRRRLTHFGPGHMTASAGWSPDGSMIVFADSGMGGNDDLYVMRADGAGVTRITRTPQWESAAVWLRP